MSDAHLHAAAAPTVKPRNRVTATWTGAHVFDSGRAGSPSAIMDGAGKAAQSPPDALLAAVASCSGIDVVDILGKRRTPVERLVVDVEGRRREESPRRFEHITLTFHVDGAGIERVHAERAVQLAFEKYCSVAATLASDIVLETIVVLNGEHGPTVRQKNFVP